MKLYLPCGNLRSEERWRWREKQRGLSDDEGENGGLESLMFDEISGNIEDTITIDENIETSPIPEPKVVVRPSN